MTLISSPTPLTSLYPYPCIPSPSTEHSYSLSPQQGLSWRQPAPVPAPTSQKYRTLASIRSQLRHQQHLPTLKSEDNNTSDIHAVSPSIKPGPLDSIAIEAPTTTTATTTTTTTTTTTIHRHHHHHHGTFPQTKSASSITQAIQEMDASYGTCFLTWIHNPANLDYISLRLRPLCLEYPLVDVANVLRWIGADWSSADCKALFRAVTQNWDQGKRRMLAFLLIRDEEMRQKAKSKLVEFAQKSKAKTIQLRRIQQLQQQQQQQQQQQRQQPQPQQEQNYHSNHQEEPSPQWHPYQRSNESRQLHQLQSIKSVSESVGSVWSSSIGSATQTTITPTAPMDHTTLEDIVAASLITGVDMTLPQPSDSDPAWDPVACALKNASSGSIRRSRYSPY